MYGHIINSVVATAIEQTSSLFVFICKKGSVLYKTSSNVDFVCFVEFNHTLLIQGE